MKLELCCFSFSTPWHYYDEKFIPIRVAGMQINGVENRCFVGRMEGWNTGGRTPSFCPSILLSFCPFHPSILQIKRAGGPSHKRASRQIAQ